MLRVAVQLQVVEMREEIVLQLHAQPSGAETLLRHLGPRQFGCLAESDDARDVERSRSHAALVTAAVDDGGDAHAGLATDPESADALRPVHLVGADGDRVHLHLLDVEGHLSESLHGVAVEQDALLAAEGTDLGDRLDGPDLVVREHDGNEDRLVGDRCAQLVEGDAAVLLDRQVRDAVALPLEALASIEHGLVLGATGDDVIAFVLVKFGDPLDGEVVRLGGAGSEDDLLAVSAQERGDLLARLLHRFLGAPAEGVAAARRVAELGGEVGHHRLEHPRIEGSRGVVVEIDGQLEHRRGPRDAEPVLDECGPVRSIIGCMRGRQGAHQASFSDVPGVQRHC